MDTLPVHPRLLQALSRRALLHRGLAAGLTVAACPLAGPAPLWGAEAGQPKRGGILRLRGVDPPHFDPHLTFNFKTHTTLSFVYNKLVRYQAGREPGTFALAPDLAERWEALDETTYVFHLRHGVLWHQKPPVHGRELVAEDVKFTFDRFLTEKANPLRYMLEPLDRIEVVNRYTLQFRLKEPYVWLVDMLANPRMWIIAREAVEQFGDLKKAESAIGTGPFLLERYEPNVKTVFTRHPAYFLQDQPYVERVEWLVLDDPSTALAMYRTGQLDCGPGQGGSFAAVRQQDLDALKRSHPHLRYQDFLSPVAQVLYMRTDQAPFHDVRVRRALSHAIDRQGLIEAVPLRGEPTPAVPRGLAEWSLPVDQLGTGAKYYQYDPKEARRLLAEAGFPGGLKTQLHATGGYGPDLLDAVQLVQRSLKDIGIEAALKLQEYGAYFATTLQGKFEGLAMGPFLPGWEPDSVLAGPYTPDSLRNSSHVNDPTLTALLQEQRRTPDLAARKQRIFDIQRYVAEQQYYVYLYCGMLTGSHQPSVKNYDPTYFTEEVGNAAAALWLER
jgi:peptide/nickel transport system substrate-binding protein